MELRDLRYFQAVAENGNITRAAHELHVAQPTISRQMQLLEAELGVTLFLRGKRHIELTPTGALFLKRVSAILSDVDLSTREIRFLKEDVQGSLSIAVSGAMGASVLAPMVHAFQQRHPLVTYVLRQPQDTAQALREGEVDVAFSMILPEREEFGYAPLLVAHLGAVMHRDHVIGQNPDIIHLSELRNVPLIVPGVYCRPLCDAFQNRGYNEPRILCRSHSTLNGLEWAEEGIGAAVSTSLCTRMSILRAGRLIFKRIIEPEFPYTGVLVWNKERTLSRAAECFIEFQREFPVSVAPAVGIGSNS